MENKVMIVVLMFMLKYFFDIEKEITHTILMTAQLRLNDCRELMTQYFDFSTLTRMLAR